MASIRRRTSSGSCVGVGLSDIDAADVHRILEGMDNMRAYWLALGEFVHFYSHVEASVTEILKQESGVLPLAANAVFSGSRMDASIGLIKRIFDARFDKLDPVLERAFAQITILNKERNRIIHHGARFTEDWSLRVSNASVSHLKSNVKVTEVSADTIREMIDDLHLIQELIGAYELSRREGNPPRSEVEHPLLHAPWRYKSPAQQTRQRQHKGQKSPQTQSRPPLSSQE